MMSEGVILCTEECDTSVSNSLRVRYKNHAKNHAMISYNYHLSFIEVAYSLSLNNYFSCSMDNLFSETHFKIVFAVHHFISS